MSATRPWLRPHASLEWKVWQDARDACADVMAIYAGDPAYSRAEQRTFRRELYDWYMADALESPALRAAMMVDDWEARRQVEEYIRELKREAQRRIWEEERWVETLRLQLVAETIRQTGRG